jgi:hypothetical protein
MDLIYIHYPCEKKKVYTIDQSFGLIFAFFFSMYFLCVNNVLFGLEKNVKETKENDINWDIYCCF